MLREAPLIMISSDDNNQSVLEELHPGSKKLYIIFGGMAGRLGIPPFEFYNSTKILEENKLFLKDFSQSWYQSGLMGVADDFYGMLAFLKERIQVISSDQLYFIGNSMGAYAAILCASCLGHGQVIAFVPPTVISPFKRLACGDRRYVLRALWLCLKHRLKGIEGIYDLRDHMKQHPGDYRVDIHVSRFTAADYQQAMRLADVPGVEIKSYDLSGHNLVCQLRDEGLLATILKGGSDD